MNPTSSLINALRNRDFPGALHALNIGGDINGWTEFDRPLLHEFVDNCAIAVVEFILLNGDRYNLDIYQLDDNGELASDIAMRKQYQLIVDLFNAYLVGKK